MMRKGLIEQQIENLGLVLAKLLKLKRDDNIVPAITQAVRAASGEPDADGSYDDALALLRTASRELAGVSLDTTLALNDESMIGLVKVGPTLAPEKALALGVLLDEWALLCHQTGDSRGAAVRSRKALLLLAEALQVESVRRHPEFTERLEDLIARVRPDALAPASALPVQLRLHAYYEQIGAYAKSEDALYALRDLDLPGLDTDYAAPFYRRLLRLSDTELDAGNLSRAEIQQALDEIAAP